MKKYQRLVIDPLATDGWILNNFKETPDKGDANLWRYSIPSSKLEAGVLSVEITTLGRMLDYNIVYPNIPIVTSKLKDLLINEEDVCFIPIKISDPPDKFHEVLFLMFIRNAINCLDEKKSTYIKWPANSPIRPDLAGQYKSITKLVVNDECASKHRIFKIKGYNSTILVNESIRALFTNHGITGVHYMN